MSSLFIKLIAFNDLQQSDCIVRQNGFKKLCILFIGVRDRQRAKTNFLLWIFSSIGQQNQQFSSGQYKDPSQSVWCFVCQIISKKCLQQLLFYFSPLSFGLNFTTKILQKLFPFLRISQFFHEAILTTNQDFESLKTFNNKSLRKPPLTDDKDVVILGDKSFSDFVNKNWHVMVDFYTPWCY